MSRDLSENLCYNFYMNVYDSKKTHFKGLLGELAFTLHFLKHGWNIYKPVDNNSRVDLVLKKEGMFKKIQIKYCTPYKGCLRVDLEHPRKTTKPYTLSEIDEIAVYDSAHEQFYLIPLIDILPKKEMWIRVSPPATKQKKKINWAEKYKI